MISGSNLIKSTYGQSFLDKENNARNANISSQVDRKNLYSQKGKKFPDGSSKSLNSLDQNENIRAVNPSINPSANPLLKPLALRTDDDINFNRRPNTNRVSKILNFEERNDTVSTNDESNYSSVHSNVSIPNKPQDYKINLDKEKFSLMHDKERKKTTVETTKPIEEDKIKHLASKLSYTEKDETASKSNQHKIIERYAPCIMRTFKQKDVAWTPKNALKNHKIPANLRAKMVDWMVEVLTSYKCSDQTFFVAMNIMDLFFQKTPIPHEVSELHLVGVTCMFIASKYEEIYPLRLSVVHEKIAHRKLSTDAIKKKEKDIMDAMEYKLTGVTPYDFMMTALYQMNLRDVLSEKMHDYLLKVCTYLLKMTMHDYDLINQQTYSELAAATIFVAFKIIEQLEKSFPLSEKARQLREVIEVDEDIMFDCATRILSMAKNFEKLYPNLENLKKFNSFSLDNSTGIFGHHSK